MLLTEHAHNDSQYLPWAQQKMTPSFQTHWPRQKRCQSLRAIDVTGEPKLIHKFSGTYFDIDSSEFRWIGKENRWGDQGIQSLTIFVGLFYSPQ